ncbi:MAG: translation initiation factor IF-2 subunit beta [Candidatus Altiarchaeota archaeon]
MDYNYENLLDRAWKNLPEKLKSPTRFEVPTADTLIEGNQTIIKNINDIESTLNREGKYILKYLSKDLAAPVLMEGSRAIVQRKIRNSIINEKIQAYAKEYVICHECGRPDTKITTLEGQKIIKCEACGGWWPLKRIK